MKPLIKHILAIAALLPFFLSCASPASYTPTMDHMGAYDAYRVGAVINGSEYHNTNRSSIQFFGTSGDSARFAADSLVYVKGLIDNISPLYDAPLFKSERIVDNRIIRFFLFLEESELLTNKCLNFTAYARPDTLEASWQKGTLKKKVISGSVGAYAIKEGKMYYDNISKVKTAYGNYAYKFDKVAFEFSAQTESGDCLYLTDGYCKP